MVLYGAPGGSHWYPSRNGGCLPGSRPPDSGVACRVGTKAAGKTGHRGDHRPRTGKTGQRGDHRLWTGESGHFRARRRRPGAKPAMGVTTDSEASCDFTMALQTPSEHDSPPAESVGECLRAVPRSDRVGTRFVAGMLWPSGRTWSPIMAFPTATRP